MISADLLLRVMGLSAMTNGREIAEALGYAEGSGAPLNTRTPKFLGQTYRDSVTGEMYIALTPASNGWRPLAPLLQDGGSGQQHFAPSALVIPTLTFPEGVENAVISEATVVDADAIDAHTFEIPNDLRFEINAGVLKLRDGVSVTFTGTPADTIPLVIVVRDLYGLATTFNVTVTVTDVVEPVTNAAPTDITLSNLSVLENVNGAVIGTLGAVDAKTPTGPFTWFIDAGAVAISKLEVSNNGVAGATQQLKYKAASAGATADSPMSVTLRVRDPEAAERTEAFSITVNANAPVNNAPTAIQLSGTDVVAGQAGFVIGTLTTTDADVGDAHTYSKVSGDAKLEVVGNRVKVKDAETIFPGQVAAVMIRFDSSATPNQFLNRGAQLGNLADGKALTIAGTIRFMGGDGAQMRIMASGNSRIRVQRNTDNTLRLRCQDTSGVTQAEIISSIPITADGAIHTFAASFNGATGAKHFIIDRVDRTDPTSFANNVDSDIASSSEFHVGQTSTGTDRLDAEINHLALDNVYVDLSSVTELNKFFTVANAVADWAATNPFGVAPSLQLQALSGETVTQFAANDGNGGAFTVNGTPTTVTVPGGGSTAAITVRTTDVAGATFDQAFTITIVDEPLPELQGTLVANPNFETIGWTWVITGGGPTVRAFCRYREAGQTDTVKQSLDFWWSPQQNRYSGKIGVGTLLAENTDYVVEFFLVQGGEESSKGFATLTTRNSAVTIGQTISVPTGVQSAPLLISGVKGNPNAWIRYTPADAGATNGQNVPHNVRILNSEYIILDGFEFINALQDAISIEAGGSGCHDIIIRNCEVTNWGRPMTNSGPTTFAARDRGILTPDGNNTGFARLTIEDCNIHDPRHRANSWVESHPDSVADGSNPLHPRGANAIFIRETPQLVVRRSSFTATTAHYFEDILSGNGSNFGFGDDSDIYSNTLEGCWDDAIETDGLDRRLMFRGNTLDRVRNFLSLAPASQGPTYIAYNILKRTQDDTSFTVNAHNGRFLKFRDTAGTAPRCYLLHNTVYKQDDNNGGCSICISGGLLVNIYARNNVWRASSRAYASPGGAAVTCDIDYDTYTGTLQNITGQANGIQAEAALTGGTPTPTGAGNCHNNGFILPSEFTYLGAAPDRGAVDTA